MLRARDFRAEKQGEEESKRDFFIITRFLVGAGVIWWFSDKYVDIYTTKSRRWLNAITIPISQNGIEEYLVFQLRMKVRAAKCLD
jgi:hypothetical protein